MFQLQLCHVILSKFSHPSGKWRLIGIPCQRWNGIPVVTLIYWVGGFTQINISHLWKRNIIDSNVPAGNLSKFSHLAHTGWQLKVNNVNSYPGSPTKDVLYPSTIGNHFLNCPTTPLTTQMTHFPLRRATGIVGNSLGNGTRDPVFSAPKEAIEMLILIGGWTNPSEKYESKWVHLPRISGWTFQNIWGTTRLDYMSGNHVLGKKALLRGECLKPQPVFGWCPKKILGGCNIETEKSWNLNWRNIFPSHEFLNLRWWRANSYYKPFL